MTRTRLLVATALTAVSLGIAAAPASATPVCHPDTICPDCSSVEIVNTWWRKLFGYDPECA